MIKFSGDALTIYFPAPWTQRVCLFFFFQRTHAQTGKCQLEAADSCQVGVVKVSVLSCKVPSSFQKPFLPHTSTNRTCSSSPPLLAPIGLGKNTDTEAVDDTKHEKYNHVVPPHGTWGRGPRGPQREGRGNGTKAPGILWLSSCWVDRRRKRMNSEFFNLGAWLRSCSSTYITW